MDEPAFVGIDLGGTLLKVVVAGEDGAIIARRQAPTKARADREELLHQVADLVEDVRAEVRTLSPMRRLVAVGLAVPGVIDALAGRVEFTVALSPAWNGFVATAALERLVSLPTVLINDAQAATLGEHVHGGGQGYRDFVCVTVGTGIGGGLVLDGRLYAGSRGMSGLVGHTTVVPNGPVCGCGNRGCVEMYASGTAITRAARAARAEGRLGELPEAGDPSSRTLAAAARAGNPVAREIYAEAGTYLGIALGNVVCTLNPRAIVVGGGVSQAGDLLLDPIRREIERRTVVFSPERGGVDVIPSPLGGDAGAIGSASWAAQGAGGA
jgi:glucokinase